jgi:DNA-binding protein H-NS
MARSLAKIKEQIAKLQKEADSIQSSVIARVKREIAQHGLTVEHLFGSASSSFVGNGSRTSTSARKPKKDAAAKPAKYADGKGNTWHGVGKRPAWLHEALASGRSLDDLLVGAKASSVAPKTVSPAAKPARKSKRGAARTKSAKTAVAAKPVRKTAAKKKTAAGSAAKKAPAKKASRAKAAAPADTNRST